MSDSAHYLKVEDYSVSHENFDLILDKELDLLVTSPRPSDENLSRYYESEDYISHTSSKRTILEKIYHFVRNYAIKRKIELCSSVQTVGSILDIGAGTGDFLYAAKERGWKTTGIEPHSPARKIACEKGLDFVDATIDVKDNSFDVITMWHVLEHVPDYDKQISELKRLLKPSGTLIIAVPNYKSYDARHYREFWAAYDVPRHLYHFSQDSIRNIFAKQYMEVRATKPMIFDAFYVSLLSEKYKYGRTNYVNAFITGLKSNWEARKTSEFSSLIYVIENGPAPLASLEKVL